MAKDNPRLNKYGVKWGADGGGDEPLRPSAVEACVDFLRLCERRPKASQASPGSYSMKHAVESCYGIGYVGDGEVLAAAIHLGIPIRLTRGEISAEIAVDFDDFMSLRRHLWKIGSIPRLSEPFSFPQGSWDEVSRQIQDGLEASPVARRRAP